MELRQWGKRQVQRFVRIHSYLKEWLGKGRFRRNWREGEKDTKKVCQKTGKALKKGVSLVQYVSRKKCRGRMGRKRGGRELLSEKGRKGKEKSGENPEKALHYMGTSSKTKTEREPIGKGKRTSLGEPGEGRSEKS